MILKLAQNNDHTYEGKQDFSVNFKFSTAFNLNEFAAAVNLTKLRLLSI